uniref:Uncharacterized protein n=1 Tax=Lygus hesperus TaxID=30085 RepID=A0A146MCK1_LYGHE
MSKYSDILLKRKRKYYKEYVNSDYEAPSSTNANRNVSDETATSTKQQDSKSMSMEYSARQFGRDPYGEYNTTNRNDFYPIVAPKFQNLDEKIQYSIYASTVMLSAVSLLARDRTVFYKLILLMNSGSMLYDVYKRYGVPRFDRAYLYSLLSNETNLQCLFM